MTLHSRSNFSCTAIESSQGVNLGGTWMKSSQTTATHDPQGHGGTGNSSCLTIVLNQGTACEDKHLRYPSPPQRITEHIVGNFHIYSDRIKLKNTARLNILQQPTQQTAPPSDIQSNTWA